MAVDSIASTFDIQADRNQGMIRPLNTISFATLICCSALLLPGPRAYSQEAVQNEKDNTTAAVNEPTNDDTQNAAAEETTRLSVGVSYRVDQVVLTAPKLEAKPVTSESPLVLRVTNVYPHGDDFRYDLEYYALEPGEYNLVDYLKRIDGLPLGFDKQILVKVEPILPPGQVEPNILPPPNLPAIGGYRMWLIAAGIVWVVGLLALVFVGRAKAQVTAEHQARPISLAERLEPMVADAVAGKLSREECADLEMGLVAHWRKRLGLENESATEVIQKLKDHNEAGPLLLQLERWLHEPGRSDGVNVAELLKPYRKIPADALLPKPAGVHS